MSDAYLCDGPIETALNKIGAMDTSHSAHLGWHLLQTETILWSIVHELNRDTTICRSRRVFIRSVGHQFSEEQRISSAHYCTVLAK
jgi:transketolase N-terminal domain/subunit